MTDLGALESLEAHNLIEYKLSSCVYEQNCINYLIEYKLFTMSNRT